jgi:hypothetical protein
MARRIAFPARTLLLILILGFATEREASAYTDPGSGALIWQALVAGVVGVGFHFQRIASWFRNKGVHGR